MPEGVSRRCVRASEVVLIGILQIRLRPSGSTTHRAWCLITATMPEVVGWHGIGLGEIILISILKVWLSSSCAAIGPRRRIAATMPKIVCWHRTRLGKIILVSVPLVRLCAGGSTAHRARRPVAATMPEVVCWHSTRCCKIVLVTAFLVGFCPGSAASGRFYACAYCKLAVPAKRAMLIRSTAMAKVLVVNVQVPGLVQLVDAAHLRRETGSSY
mmetsp:Transcript_36793/g.97238  ORF Transcript_36793/g.97238 Transcript_36793/m.97238 type:complete len:214 (-) Transcript_36793:115-756(-)